MNKRDALTTAQLHTLVAGLDLASKRGLRDRAILLIGYAGAFRRSELAPLLVEQLRRRGDAYVLFLVRTKSDQESHGRDVGIPAFAGSSLCPVAALDTWLTVAAISTGPVFRKVTRYDTVTSQALAPSTVALIVKRAANAAGIPPSRLAGHSLRSGHATTASENGPGAGWRVRRPVECSDSPGGAPRCCPQSVPRSEMEVGSPQAEQPALWDELPCLQREPGLSVCG